MTIIHKYRHILLSSLIAIAPQIAWAEEVTLTANDGSMKVDGDLLGVENGKYNLRTALGDISLDITTVTCSGPGCPAEQAAHSGNVDVLLRGSDTVGEGLMPLLLEGYAVYKQAALEVEQVGDHDVVVEVIGDEGYGESLGVFEVVSTGSSDAFKLLLTNETDIGMSSRRIKPQEARELSRSGSGPMTSIEQEHIIAVDSLVISVHPDNPVNSISIEDLSRVYSGAITNWSQLGGIDSPITVLTRKEGSGTRSVFEGRIMAGAQIFSGAQESESNNTLSNEILSNPNAIGYLGYAYQNGTKGLKLISECGISTVPDEFSAKTEEYPLQRRLYLYNRGDVTNELLDDLIGYAIHSDADGVITKAGFINQGIVRVSQENSQARMNDLIRNTTNTFELGLMRELLVEMFQWDRLSTTFRFASGSNNLERKSSLDLERLVDYLIEQPAGTKIALVGFTDSDGVFNANKTLSENRAAAALDAVRAFAGNQVDHIEFTTFGFGELAPATCNFTNDDKRTNRRVEVWISSAN